MGRGTEANIATPMLHAGTAKRRAISVATARSQKNPR